jgi:CheY-like chemotaxis protein
LAISGRFDGNAPSCLRLSVLSFPLMQIQKVLLVDDDADFRQICNLTLRTIGKWQVVLATSGQEALEKAEQDKPDLIVLDVSMPDIDGIETLVKLRNMAHLKTTPVILMTAELESSKKGQCDSLGVVGVIAKPINALELPHEIERPVAKL